MGGAGGAAAAVGGVLPGETVWESLLRYASRLPHPPLSPRQPLSSLLSVGG